MVHVGFDWKCSVTSAQVSLHLFHEGPLWKGTFNFHRISWSLPLEKRDSCPFLSSSLSHFNRFFLPSLYLSLSLSHLPVDFRFGSWMQSSGATEKKREREREKSEYDYWRVTGGRRMKMEGKEGGSEATENVSLKRKEKQRQRMGQKYQRNDWGRERENWYQSNDVLKVQWEEGRKNWPLSFCPATENNKAVFLASFFYLSSILFQWLLFLPFPSSDRWEERERRMEMGSKIVRDKSEELREVQFKNLQLNCFDWTDDWRRQTGGFLIKTVANHIKEKRSHRKRRRKRDGEQTVLDGGSRIHRKNSNQKRNQRA